MVSPIYYFSILIHSALVAYLKFVAPLLIICFYWSLYLILLNFFINYIIIFLLQLYFQFFYGFNNFFIQLLLCCYFLSDFLFLQQYILLLFMNLYFHYLNTTPIFLNWTICFLSFKCEELPIFISLFIFLIRSFSIFIFVCSIYWNFSLFLKS